MATSTTGNTYPPTRNTTGRVVGLSVLVVVLLTGLVAASAYVWRSHFSGPHGVITYEVTGEPGATADVTRVLPKSDGGGAVTMAKQTLPFTSKAIVDPGTFEVRATASRGALTCRIVVDGKEKANRTGIPGQPVTCTVTVDAP